MPDGDESTGNTNAGLATGEVLLKTPKHQVIFRSNLNGGDYLAYQRVVMGGTKFSTGEGGEVVAEPNAAWVIDNTEAAIRRLVTKVDGREVSGAEALALVEQFDVPDFKLVADKARELFKPLQTGERGATDAKKKSGPGNTTG